MTIKTMRGVAAFRTLREQPMWRLLAAHRAPVILALLQGTFLDSDKTLPGSVLIERLTRDFEQLRVAGEELPQTPQAAVAEWLSQGWLIRRLPAGASEEEYELASDAISAVRFASGALKPRTTATESRLSTVIQQLSRLAEDTDADADRRLAALMAERERIDSQILALERDGVRVLPDDRALERAREVISLAEELTTDFRNVRDEFDRLNRGLRQSLLDNDGSRGDVLESLFDGVDLIGESEAGRTFHAFWGLLTDSEQSMTLVDALQAVIDRPFASKLDTSERKFLLGLTSRLMDEGRGVHDVLQHFARSLKSFVQSREFLEQRRLHSLLKQATQAALTAKDNVRANADIDFSLMQTSSKLRSLSQWALNDPADRVTDASMAPPELAELSLDLVADMVRQAEIDFRTLRAHIRTALAAKSQVSVGDILAVSPPEQGLGSVVGYLVLAARHGETTKQHEQVTWQSQDGGTRSARIPLVFFLKEKQHEFAD